MYRSGDLARRLADGSLEYLGRIDHQVKIRGHRIELAEIECALREHEDVHDAAVAPARDGAAEACGSWLTWSAGWSRARRRAHAELRRHLTARLPAPMLPAAFIALGALPLNRNGKLDAARCPRGRDAAVARGAFRAAGDRAGAADCGGARRAAAVDAVGLDDDLFELGRIR